MPELAVQIFARTRLPRRARLVRSRPHVGSGFVRRATLTEHLLKPALAAAEQLLPVNHGPVIDGFHAVNGIIHSAYDGILSAPRGIKPAPFEIILESPAAAPLQLQRAALLLTVTEIIRHYRKMIALGADL